MTRLTWRGNQQAQKQADDAWKKLKASSAKSKAKSKREAKKKRKLAAQKIRLAKSLLTVDPMTIILPDERCK